jgi:hypothetical protein
MSFAGTGGVAGVGGVAAGAMPFGPGAVSGATAGTHCGAAMLIGSYQSDHQHKHPHPELLCVLGLALLQMGGGLPAVSGVHEGVGRMAVGGAAAIDAGMNNGARDSMHQMLHSLVQAGKKHATGGFSFESDLQGLISAMGASQGAGQEPGSPAIKQLQHDFTQMVSAVHGPGAAAGAQMHLAGFLQTMQAGLAGGGVPASGGLVNTSA